MSDREHRLRTLCSRARDLLEEACEGGEKCPWCNAPHCHHESSHRESCEMRKLLIDMAMEGI